jgi:O-antigen/teichoic acid export membrane protein
LSIAHALKWSFLSELASKAIAPLAMILLARMLTPEDFGVVAAATMVISLSQILWEGGMGKAIIQFRGDVAAASNTAFLINCLLGILVACLLIAVSRPLALHVFHDPRVAPVLKVMSLQVLLGSLACVQAALLQKNMNFKRLFWVRVATVALPGLVAIPLALTGLGYWALILGTLAGQVAQVAVLWSTTRWHPSLTFDRQIARTLARFSAWVMASGLLVWLYTWADSLVVGMYLGAHDLGLYRTGNYLVATFYTLLFAPLLPVLYSHFSAMQGDVERIRDTLRNTIKIVTYISIPTALLIYTVGPHLSSLLLGRQWEGVGQVVAVMALMHGFSWVVGINGEAYRAIGRPDFETKIMAGALALYVVAYWLSIQAGFGAFLWTRFGIVIPAMAVHLWIAKIAIGLSVRQTITYTLKITAAGVPLLIVSHVLSHPGQLTAPQIAGIAVTLIAIAAGYLWAIERKNLIPQIFAVLGRKSHVASSNAA